MQVRFPQAAAAAPSLNPCDRHCAATQPPGGQERPSAQRPAPVLVGAPAALTFGVLLAFYDLPLGPLFPIIRSFPVNERHSGISAAKNEIIPCCSRRKSPQPFAVPPFHAQLSNRLQPSTRTVARPGTLALRIHPPARVDDEEMRALRRRFPQAKSMSLLKPLPSSSPSTHPYRPTICKVRTSRCLDGGWPHHTRPTFASRSLRAASNGAPDYASLDWCAPKETCPNRDHHQRCFTQPVFSAFVQRFSMTWVASSSGPRAFFSRHLGGVNKMRLSMLQAGSTPWTEGGLACIGGSGNRVLPLEGAAFLPFPCN